MLLYSSAICNIYVVNSLPIIGITLGTNRPPVKNDYDIPTARHPVCVYIYLIV